MQRLHGDGGSVLAESAIVLPLLVMLFAGVVDFGVGLRDKTIVQGAMRTAARVGAAAKNNGNADQAMLTALNANLGVNPSLVVNKVVIYQTNSGTLNGAMPTSCTTVLVSSGPTVGAGSTGYCNVYRADQVSGAATSTSFTAAGASSCSGTAIDRFWCPTTRDILLTSNAGSGADAGPDYLGINIVTTYTPFTKIFKASFTITDTVVVRLEPDA